MIDHKSPVPLHKQVREYIKKQIEAGILKEDEQIPSERELCELFDISRTTVRQAINDAVNEGILSRIPGKGTFVDRLKFDQGLLNMATFEDTVRLRGLNPRTIVVSDGVIKVGARVGKALGLEPGTEAVHIVLLGYADDEPVAHYNSYLPLAIGHMVAATARIWSAEGQSFSTYQLYSGRNGIDPYITTQTFEAAVADEKLGDTLCISAGAPIFKVTSVIHTRGDIPIEYKEVYYRGDKFKFSISRRHS